jgi:hypothetical protein
MLENCSGVDDIKRSWLEVVGDNIVGEYPYSLVRERRQETRVDVGRSDECWIIRLSSEPTRDRARAGSDFEATAAFAKSRSLDGGNAERVNDRGKQT